MYFFLQPEANQRDHFARESAFARSMAARREALARDFNDDDDDECGCDCGCCDCEREDDWDNGF